MSNVRPRLSPRLIFPHGAFFALIFLLAFGFGPGAAHAAIPTANLLGFAKTNEVAMEGEGTVRVMVVRQSGTRGKISVDVNVKADTNKYMGSFTTTNLVLNDYQLSAYCDLAITDNGATNADATVTFELKNPKLAAGQDPSLTPTLDAGTSTMNLKISDDDDPFTISFTKITFTGEEGGNITATVKLGAAAKPADLSGISVDYDLDVLGYKDLGPGADFADVKDDPQTPEDDNDLGAAAALSGTLTFNTQGTATLRIPILDDKRLEFTEEFGIYLSNAKGDAQDPNSTNTADRVKYVLNKQAYARGRILFNTNFLTEPMASGSVDQRFNPENADPLRLKNPGANGPVTAVAVDSKTNYYVAGNFTAVDATIRYGLAKLNSTGGVDTAFISNLNLNGSVTSMGLHDSGTNAGKVVIGGSFTSVGGQPRASVARYLTNGALDSNFSIGLGANGIIYALKIEQDGSILVGGDFTSFDGIPRGRIARLRPDGKLDQNSFTGKGADGPIFDFATQGIPTVNFSDSRTSTTNSFTRTVAIPSKGGVLQFTYDTGFEPDQIIIRFGSQTLTNAVFTNSFVVNTDTNGNSVTSSVPATIRFDLGPLATGTNNLVITVNANNLDENNPLGLTNATTWSYSAVVAPSGTVSIVAVGNFTSFDDVPVNHIVKVDGLGNVDGVFAANIGTGASAVVQAIDMQSNGNYIIGGTFSEFNSVPANRIARLSKDGVPDINFATGTGANGAVRDIYVDKSAATNRHDKIYIAGDFTQFNGSRRIFLARLFPDGYLDTGFMDSAYNQFAGFPNSSGFAPNGTVASVTVGPDNNVFVGGIFDTVGGGPARDAVKPRQNFARVLGGTTPGPGSVTFDDIQFGADENGGSLTALFTRDNQTTNSLVGFGLLTVVTEDGSAIAPQDYTSLAITNGIMDPRTNNWHVEIPIVDDTIIEGDEEFFIRFLDAAAVVLLGGEPVYPEMSFGPIKDTIGKIIENDVQPAVISFAKPEYFVDENKSFATVDVYRTGNVDGRVTVQYSALVATGKTNAATDVLDFTSLTNLILTFDAGVTNASFTVPIRDDQVVEVDEVVQLSLNTPSPGAILNTNASTATLTIIDNDLPSGKIDFVSATNVVVEGQTNAVVTLARTGGAVGFITVDYATVDDTATNNGDYLSRSGRLQWNDKDITTRTITIPIVDDQLVEPLERFKIILLNPSQTNIIGNRNPTTFVNIVDNDFYGKLQFGAPEYFADENGNGAVIQVVRRDGNAGTVSVNYATSPGTAPATAAVPGQDYNDVSGTLTFGPGETAKSFVVPILDDTIADGLRIVQLKLSSPTNGTLGTNATVNLSIIDNESQNIPAGSVETDFAVGDGANGPVNAVALQNDATDTTRKIIIAGDFTQYNHILRDKIARLNNDGTLDTKYAVNTLVDAPIRAMTLLPDGNLVIGGFFTSVDATPFNYLAMLNSIGHLNTLFNPGSGPDNTVFAVAQTYAGNPTNKDLRILIGGEFVNYDSTPSLRVAMVRPDGSLDPNFSAAAGPDSTVFAIAVQRDQKILIGGDFFKVGNVDRSHIARLNPDGSLDTTFDPGTGFDATVRTITIQDDDKILVGGDFSNFNGTPQGKVARLNVTGQLDSTFVTGAGADATVNSIGLEQDGKIVLGGNFNLFNGAFRRALVRLNPTGDIDNSFNPGSGPNGVVNALAVQSNRRIVIGGGFTAVDGVPRFRIARVFGGSLAGAGAVEFDSASFTASEASGNATLLVRRTGGLEGTVKVDYYTTPITATPGSDYTDVTNTLTFLPGEVFKLIQVPLLDDLIPEDSEFVAVTLTNVVGGILGNQPVTTLEITSDDSTFAFSSDNYVVSENAPGARAVVTITRQGESSNSVTLQFQTSNGTATAGSDYTAVSTSITFAAGETNKTVNVPLIDDSLVEGNETINLSLTLTTPNPTVTITRPTSVITIADDDKAPGTLDIAGGTTVPENAGSITLTVTRSAGQQGTVAVNYATEDGTATAGSDYTAISGTLIFQATDSAKTITIPIANDTEVEGNETFRVRLSNPTGGAVLGSSSTVTVVIQDDDIGPGSLDQTFDVGTGAGGSNVFAMMLQADGKVVIGGDFLNFNNSGRSRIARLNTDGGIDTTFNAGTGPSGPVYALAPAPGGKITVGGDFRVFALQDELYLTRVTGSGALDTTMSASAGLNAAVYTIAPQPDTKVVVGGAFDVPTPHAARINASGQLDVSFNVGQGANTNVLDAAVLADGRVVLGGMFTNFGGTVRGRLVRLLSNGLIDPSFNSAPNNGANNTIYRVLPTADGKLLVAGNFTQFNGQSIARVMRLNEDGSIDSTYQRGGTNSGPNAVVRAMALQSDGKVLIGGDFTSVDGKTRNRLARLNADGSLDLSFNPGLGPNDTVLDIEIQTDGGILIAGKFTQVNGFPRAGVARITAAFPKFPITTFGITGGDLQLTFASQTGVTYDVLTSTDLKTWTIFKTVTATGPSTTVTGLPTDTQTRFFEVRIPQ